MPRVGRASSPHLRRVPLQFRCPRGRVVRQGVPGRSRLLEGQTTYVSERYGQDRSSSCDPLGPWHRVGKRRNYPRDEVQAEHGRDRVECRKILPLVRCHTPHREETRLVHGRTAALRAPAFPLGTTSVTSGNERHGHSSRSLGRRIKEGQVGPARPKVIQGTVAELQSAVGRRRIPISSTGLASGKPVVSNSLGGHKPGSVAKGCNVRLGTVGPTPYSGMRTRSRPNLGGATARSRGQRPSGFAGSSCRPRGAGDRQRRGRQEGPGREKPRAPGLTSS